MINKCLVLLVLWSCPSFAQKSSDVSNPVKGNYLGQMPPGLTPRIFAKGIISTPEMENNIAFSPDGREIYIERTTTGKSIIFCYRMIDSLWTGPIEIKFSDGGTYGQPQFDLSTGNLLTNKVTISAGNPPKTEIVVHKWMDSIWNPYKVLFPGMRATAAANGNIYVTVIDFSRGLFGKIVRYSCNQQEFAGPFDLSSKINKPDYSSDHSLISPDESFLIYSSGRDNQHNGAMYLSFKNPSGLWEDPVNLSEILKTKAVGVEWLPTLSPDGKYLFYNVGGDIFWVDARLIERFRHNK